MSQVLLDKSDEDNAYSSMFMMVTKPCRDLGFTVVVADNYSPAQKYKKLISQQWKNNRWNKSVERSRSQSSQNAWEQSQRALMASDSTAIRTEHAKRLNAS